MPLFDHFHPPPSDRRQWQSFHSVWASMIAIDLNRQLPPGYFADPTVEFNIEIDVGAFEEDKPGSLPTGWTPPAPTMTVPMTLITDVVEIAVYNKEAGPVLVGAIELVSPANKGRRSTRDAFTSKCAAFLQQAIGLIVVYIVTERRADLHGDLLRRLNDAGNPPPADLWAAAYRPWQGSRRNGTGNLAPPARDWWIVASVASLAEKRPLRQARPGSHLHVHASRTPHARPDERPTVGVVRSWRAACQNPATLSPR